MKKTIAGLGARRVVRPAGGTVSIVIVSGVIIQVLRDTVFSKDQFGMLMRLPLYPPLGFKLPAIFVKEAIIAATPYQLAKSSLAKVMNETVLRANHPIPVCFTRSE
jgi:hypothetical protein